MPGDISMSTLITSTVQGVQNIKYDASTTAITVDSGGRVKLPANPMFAAYRVSNYAVGGSYTEIVFDQEDFDVGGNYNVSNGRFTAPVAGIYEFRLATIDMAHNTCVRWRVRVNGADQAGGVREHRKDQTGHGNANSYSVNSEYTSIIQWSAGDYVSNWVLSDSGTHTAYGSTSYRYNYFMGKLLV